MFSRLCLDPSKLHVTNFCSLVNKNGDIILHRKTSKDRVGPSARMYRLHHDDDFAHGVSLRAIRGSHETHSSTILELSTTLLVTSSYRTPTKGALRDERCIANPRAAPT